MPEAHRGFWWVTSEAAERLLRYGIGHEHAVISKTRDRLTAKLRKSDAGPVLSASYGEWKQVRQAGKPAPYMPHGQGGPGNSVEQVWAKHRHELPVMFCAAERGKLAGQNCYPLDGQPKVDRWIGHKPASQKPAIAVSFRWRESTCALGHYRDALASFIKEAQERGWEVWGHGHPLAWKTRFKPLWQSLGVRFTGDFETIMDRAHVYCADASSTSFEFAATGRPVVFLDSPIYEPRRETLWHRFSHAYIGETCEDPRMLADVVAAALQDTPEQQERRARGVADIFGANDGRSSERAAAYLVELFS